MVQQTQKIQEQELEIPAEVISKFDGDKQLVQEVLSQGYSVEELLTSQIVHPTRMDPVCLVNGEPIAIWLYSNNSHHTNKGVGYSDDSWEQTVLQRRQQQL